MDLPRPTGTSSLRLRAAQITLRRMKAQGHDYLDLRQDGKRIIYLCILCLKPCYSEPILFQHLKGNEHNKMVESANLTMRLQNPWPFNDGMVFFNWERDQQPALGGWNDGRVRLIEAADSAENAGAIVRYSGKEADGSDSSDSLDHISDEESEEISLISSGEVPDLVVPGVLWKGDVGDLELKYLGLGQIGARYYKEKNDKGSDKISKIWCQWLGEKCVDDEDVALLPELDVAVVTFRYAMELSMGWEDEKEDIDDADCNGQLNEKEKNENGGSKKKKRKSKSFSDPEDTSESFANHCAASFEDSSKTSRCKEIVVSQSNSLPSLFCTDGLMLTGSTANKALRKEIRKRQRVAARRMCDLCHHKMQPGKDVAALLNLKTGKLGCSSRNFNGAFHVFHISCLLHWILLCEYERLSNLGETFNREHLAKKRRIVARSQEENGIEPFESRIHSKACPACQGTGKNLKGGKLEQTPISQSQMFKYMIKAFDGKRAWIKNPEILQNCSVGLHYPPQSEEAVTEELVATLRVLHFYAAGGDPCEN